MRVDIDMHAQTPEQDAAEPHVLAVDDDPIIREMIADYLKKHDLRVTVVADGRAMREVLAAEVVDLIVLDLKLRTEDGMNLARTLRDDSTIPIIMLTGRSDEADRVMGLELGADDYVTKPFSPRELLARIRTVLRRRHAEVRQGRPEGIRAYRFDGWELNLNTRRLTAPGGEVTVLSKGPAAGPFAAAQRRSLQPRRRHPDHAAQAQDRAGYGQAEVHPHRARQRLRIQRQRGYGLLVSPETPRPRPETGPRLSQLLMASRHSDVTATGASQ